MGDGAFGGYSACPPAGASARLQANTAVPRWAMECARNRGRTYAVEYGDSQATASNSSRKAMGNCVSPIVDLKKRLYPLPNDTKLVSKVIEIMLTLALREFASHFRYRLEFAQHQNHYPDVTIHDENGNLFALDIKTAYREGKGVTSGMTLGTFTGYFRDRAGTKNISYPYRSYRAHLVLGVIYSRVGASLPPQVYALEQIDSLPIPLKDFEVFVQPKYRIASDRPGSGNTKNIGAVREVDALINGRGSFPT